MSEPTPPTDGASVKQVLDDLCTWKDCSKRRDGEYRLEAHCRNCCTDVVVRLTKGHPQPGYGQGPECPTCGCRDWSWRGVAA